MCDHHIFIDVECRFCVFEQLFFSHFVEVDTQQMPVKVWAK